MTDDTKPKGGRPTTDLQTRLSEKLGHWPDLTGWPNKATPCWPGPRLIWHDGKMMPTPRACLSLLFDLHSSHRLSHQGTRGPYLLCVTDTRTEDRGPRTLLHADDLPTGWVPCVNPHHYRPEIVSSDPDAIPLPWLAQQAAMPPSREQDVAECADTIAAMELRHETAEEVFERLGKVYPLDVVQEALIQAKEL